MITFPEQFVKLKHPGYFWNTEEKRLYSIKIGGVLKPMKLHQYIKGKNGSLMSFPHYRISQDGRSKSLGYDTLLWKFSKVKPSELKEQIDLFK